MGFEEAQHLVRNASRENNFIPINSVDLYRNLIKVRSGNHHVTTTHHQSNLHTIPTSHIEETLVSRPAQMIVPQASTTIINETLINPTPIVTQQVRPFVSPPKTTTIETRPAPVLSVNTGHLNTGIIHSNPYKPMQTAKTSNLKFNYEQPKEYFQPSMNYGFRWWWLIAYQL